MKKLVLFIVPVCILLSSCTNTLTPPIVRTISASAQSATTITATGKILSDYGLSILSYGLCLSQDSLPTTSDTKKEHLHDTYIMETEFNDSFTGLAMNETYYVRAYAINSDGVAYGKSICVKTYFPIILSTETPTTITLNSAVCSGNISNDSKFKITACGFCWTTTKNPTINDNKTINGKEAGAFCDTLTGLKSNTTYYIRTYATSNNGTIYGNEVAFQTLKWDDATTVTDIDGNIYHTVTIGTQVWMVENLKTTRYRNGDLIGTTSADITNEINPKYQWPCNLDEKNVSTYGRYYTWYAVDDKRNICPEGWHVPSIYEWLILYNYISDKYGFQYGLNMATVMSSTTNWIWHCDNVTNSTGFTALPGDYLAPSGQQPWDFGLLAYWWSSTARSNNIAYFSDMTTCDFSTGDYTIFPNSNFGMSVRCVLN